MPGTRTVGYPEIGRDTDQSDVDVVECSRKRGAHAVPDVTRRLIPVVSRCQQVSTQARAEVADGGALYDCLSSRELYRA